MYPSPSNLHREKARMSLRTSNFSTESLYKQRAQKNIIYMSMNKNDKFFYYVTSEIVFVL